MEINAKSDSAVFHAYVRNDLLPSVADITRAMSSRGFKVEIPEVEAFAADTAQALPVKVDAQDVPVSFQFLSDKDGGFDALRSGIAEHYDQGTYKEVLRQMELRLSFEGDANWCRELARTVALLGAGAYENPSNQKLLFYGR